MARFQYQALSASGEVVAGEIDGPDVKTVIARLNEQALLPIEATESARVSALTSICHSVGATVSRRADLPCSFSS